MKVRLTSLLMAVLVILCICQKGYADFPVCTAESIQESPAINGDIIVWQDARNDSQRVVEAF